MGIIRSALKTAAKEVLFVAAVYVTKKVAENIAAKVAETVSKKKRSAN